MDSIIINLEKKIDSFVEAYKKINNKNIVLEQENDKLFIELEQKEREIINLKEKIKIMNISKSVDSSEEDIQLTRLKINEYVREIDKCISLLNR